MRTLNLQPNLPNGLQSGTHTPAQVCLPASTEKFEQCASEEVYFMYECTFKSTWLNFAWTGIIFTDIQALSVEVQFFLCPEN